MKFPIIILAAVAFGTVAAFSIKKTPSENKQESTLFEPVAVIELFTSQGCSSCPAADRLLTRTIEASAQKDQKIFALSFHVDYWNRLGWADPFSSARFTRRQSEYVSAMNLNGAYTPQMVVNGRSEFVGSDKTSLSRSLSKALATKAGVYFTKLTALNSAGIIKLQYALDGKFAGMNINVALVSAEEITVVKRGENGGRTLKNENVVRQFITEKAGAAGEISFSASPVPAKNNMVIVAYVQEENTGGIVGAAMVKM